MPKRKIPLINEEIYHIYNSSIANFKIFNTKKDYQRMFQTMAYYAQENLPYPFSQLEKRKDKTGIFPNARKSKKLVDIIAYCIMPTHIHLILKQVENKGITKFMNVVSLSYSHYFNIKHNRKGPLWASRFNNVIINTDEYFLHLTRYIHLNPVTAKLVDDPKNWEYSSYKEYITTEYRNRKVCNFSDYFNMLSLSYIKFVKDRISYQRELALIKYLMLD